MRDLAHIGGHDRRWTQRYRKSDDFAVDNRGGLRDREQCSHSSFSSGKQNPRASAISGYFVVAASVPHRLAIKLGDVGAITGGLPPRNSDVASVSDSVNARFAAITSGPSPSAVGRDEPVGLARSESTLMANRTTQFLSARSILERQTSVSRRAVSSCVDLLQERRVASATDGSFREIR
jgi:hypothetical protein